MTGFEDAAFFSKLTSQQQEQVRSAVRIHSFSAGKEVYRGDCAGLILVKKGRLRVFTLSKEGREITLYRLMQGDICLLSASCMLTGISFDVFIRAETDTEIILLPSEIYKSLSQSSIAVASFTSELMGKRFSSAMWVLDEVLNKKFDARLASLLLEEAEYSGSKLLKITHEQLASHLGTVREAVSRMLKYFEEEGIVSLSRGTVELTDLDALRSLADE